MTIQYVGRSQILFYIFQVSGEGEGGWDHIVIPLSRRRSGSKIWALFFIHLCYNIYIIYFWLCIPRGQSWGYLQYSPRQLTMSKKNSAWPLTLTRVNLKRKIPGGWSQNIDTSSTLCESWPPWRTHRKKNQRKTTDKNRSMYHCLLENRSIYDSWKEKRSIYDSW